MQSAACLIALFGALPPPWYGDFCLEKPLPSGAATFLNGWDENLCESAIRFLGQCDEHPDPIGVYHVGQEYYAVLVPGERLIVRPHLKGIHVSKHGRHASAVVVGFSRPEDLSTCTLGKVVAIDMQGRVYRYTATDLGASRGLSESIRRYLLNREEGVREARRRNAESRAAEEAAARRALVKRAGVAVFSVMVLLGIGLFLRRGRTQPH
jgi:hypothetical protein